ncbi:MAG: hypothetical protein F6K30_09740 [Cyanothece sp. SIO2G6]|nr:hypothetical protein [Cyanothece sp. SIO2G6]
MGRSLPIIGDRPPSHIYKREFPVPVWGKSGINAIAQALRSSQPSTAT